MYTKINSIEELEKATKDNAAALVYFSHEKCNVCKVLKPKIEELMQERFPEIMLFHSDTVQEPEIAAQQRAFTVPTLVVYFDGREFFRRSRNIGIEELRGEIERPYQLMFS